MNRTNRLRSNLVLPVKRRNANAARLRWGFLLPGPLAFTTAMLADFYQDFRGDDELGTIGTFHLHVADIALATGLIALIASHRTKRSLNITNLLVAVIAVVITFTILRGLQASPFMALFVFRPRAVPILFLLYFTLSGRKLDPLSHYEPWIFFWAWAIFTLFFLRTLFGPTLFLAHDSTSYIEIANLEFRPLFATSALFLVLVFVLVLEMRRHAEDVAKRFLYLLFLIVTFAVIVLSRERTDLAACLAAVLVFYLADYKLRRRSALVLALIAIGVIAVSLIWASGSLSELVALLPAQLRSSLERTSTLEIREKVWAFALGSRFATWDIIRQLFGPPSGEQLDIMVNYRLWHFSLHSQYIATIMNYGIVGALAWSALIFVGIVNASLHLRDGRSSRVGLSPRLVLAWFTALLVYGFSYEWANGAGFFIGMVLAGWPVVKVSQKNLFLPLARISQTREVHRG